jgi:hypothetical protein
MKQRKRVIMRSLSILALMLVLGDCDIVKGQSSKALVYSSQVDDRVLRIQSLLNEVDVRLELTTDFPTLSEYDAVFAFYSYSDPIDSAQQDAFVKYLDAGGSFMSKVVDGALHRSRSLGSELEILLSLLPQLQLPLEVYRELKVTSLRISP